MEGRTPKSERDKMQKVTEEIALLEEEYAGNAPVNVLISNMEEKYNVSQDKVENIIRNLRQKGVIYEPNTGYVRRAWTQNTKFQFYFLYGSIINFF